MAIIINHVTSNDVYSRIFEDIFQYFSRYTSGLAKQVVSEHPIVGAHLRHYHRPHLEKRLISPCVTTIHHDLDNPDDWLSLDRFLDRYREADMVICLNSRQKAKLAEHGIHHTCVIPHGYNHHLIDTARQKGRIKQERFILGLISKRYARKFKGEAYLSELAKRLDPSRIGFFLSGEDRAEEGRMLRQLGFATQVYERLPYRTLIDAYRGIDALLMVSAFEGGPANIPEAAAMGVPVLANPIGMVPDLIEHGRHGLHLSMNPTVDAEVINRLALRTDASYASLQESSQRTNPHLITWQDSILMNTRQHVALIKGAQHSIDQALDALG